MDCPTCGNEVKQTGRGRPKIYCDDNCAEFEAASTVWEHRALIVSRKATPQARKALRSRMWKAANIFNNTRPT